MHRAYFVRPGESFVFFHAFHGVEPHHGAVFLFSKSRSAVWCASFLGNRMVRCGAVFTFSKSDGAARCVFFSTVRCGADFAFLRIVRCGTVSVQQLLPTGKVHAPY